MEDYSSDYPSKTIIISGINTLVSSPTFKSGPYDFSISLTNRMQ